MIEQQGDPETIYRRPANAYVADFIGGSNLIAGKVTECADGVAVIETAFGPAHAPCAKGSRAAPPRRCACAPSN